MSLDIFASSSVAFTASSPLSSWWCPGEYAPSPECLSKPVEFIPTISLPITVIAACEPTKHDSHRETFSHQGNEELSVLPDDRMNGNSRKEEFVESLVDTAASIIEAIWPHHSYSARSRLLPLRRFIQEILRRSKTSFSTLQLALLYLVRLRKSLMPFPLHDDASSTTSQTPHPSLCGRRMFLSSLIVAAKYLQDRTYSNHAWAKISGLPLEEVNSNEREFLKSVKYDLYVSSRTFVSWSTVLLRKAFGGMASDTPRRVCVEGGRKQNVGKPKGIPVVEGVDSTKRTLPVKTQVHPSCNVPVGATHLPSPALTEGSDIDSFPESNPVPSDGSNMEPYIRMEALCEEVGMAEFCSMLPSPELSPQVAGQKRSLKDGLDVDVVGSSCFKRSRSCY